MLPPSSSGRESSGTSSHTVPPSARKYNSLNSADLYQAGKDLGSQEERIDLYELPRRERILEFRGAGALSESQHSPTDGGKE